MGRLVSDAFCFLPKLIAESNLTRSPWSSEDLPPRQLTGPELLTDCQELLLNLFDNGRKYKLWVATHADGDHRDRTLFEWKKKHSWAIPAEEMADAWNALGVAISADPERFIRFCKVSSKPRP